MQELMSGSRSTKRIATARADANVTRDSCGTAARFGRRRGDRAHDASVDSRPAAAGKGAARTTLPAIVGAALLWTLPVAVGGCDVGPDFTRPETPVPASWGAAGDPRLTPQTATDVVWWREFHDAALDGLVEVAYRQNLPLRIAGLRIVEARARYGVVTGQQFPQQQELFASGTAVGLSRNAPNAGTGPRYYGDLQLGFDADWELDFWGKYRRGVEAEAASLLASVADYYSAIVSLTAEVAHTYVMIRTFEVLIQQFEENVRVQSEALAIAQSRYNNGATSELDPTQARTQLETTRASIPKLRVELQRARNALSTLLGQPTGTLDRWLAGPKVIPKAPARVAVGVPAEMLRRRPDIRSAELNAAAQCARIGIAKSALYPSFSLTGTVGVDGSVDSNGFHTPFSSDSIFFSAGPRIDWSILNYGRITNAVRVEDARFEQLLVRYRDIVLRAAQEVEDAQSGFLNAQEAMVFEQNAVAASQRAVELAIVQYREGATGFERVLDAQQALLQEQSSLAQTTSSVATNLIALYKALGGGWELRQGLAVVPEQTQRKMKERTDWGDVLSQPRSPEPNPKRPPPAGKH